MKINLDKSPLQMISSCAHTNCVKWILCDVSVTESSFKSNKPRLYPNLYMFTKADCLGQTKSYDVSSQ